MKNIDELLKWSIVLNKYQFVIHYTGNGQYDIIKKIDCDLNDTEQFNKIYDILSYLDEAVLKNFKNGSQEDVVNYIKVKTNINENEINNIIKDLVFGNIKDEIFLELVSYIEIFKYDNNVLKLTYLEKNINKLQNKIR